MSKPYRPIDEVMEIFQISLATVKSVLKKHKVDCFSNKGKLYIHAKEFYAAYTKHFNPSLFDVDKTKDKKITNKKESNKLDYSDIFQKLFGSSYETKKRRKVSATSFWHTKTF